jgi:hypothetical protein
MLIAKAPGFSSETHNVAGNQNGQFDFSLRKPQAINCDTHPISSAKTNQ